MCKRNKIFVVVIILVIISATVTIRVITQWNSYEIATEYLDSGEFERAEELFSALKNYKNSSDMVKEAIYRNALQKKANAEYEAAISMLQEIGDYKDSEGILTDCTYLFGNSLFDMGQYTKAIEQFDKVEGYKDSFTRKQEAIYQRGIYYINNHEYINAIADFEQILGYNDSEIQLKEAKYQQASVYMENQRYNDAHGFFEDLNYKDSNTQAKEASYHMALKILDGDSPEEARELLLSLGNYKNAKNLLNRFKYVLVKETNTRFDGVITTKVYEYDKANNLIKTVDDGVVTTYTYNSSGKLMTKNSEDGMCSRYIYDANGILVKETGTMKDGGTYLCVFDNKGRVLDKERVYPNGTVDIYDYAYYDDEDVGYNKYELCRSNSGYWSSKVWFDDYGNEELEWREVYEEGVRYNKYKYEHKYVYDENGNMLKDSWYCDGRLEHYNEYKYDDLGNEIEFVCRLKDGDFVSKTIFTYEYKYVVE